MPLEIKDLTIRTTIKDQAPESQVVSNEGSVTEHDAEQIISVCVSRVMEILNNQKDR